MDVFVEGQKYVKATWAVNMNKPSVTGLISRHACDTKAERDLK